MSSPVCNATPQAGSLQIPGDAWLLEVLVTQLNMRLQAAERQIEQFNCFKPAGAATQYEQNNRRGAGGSNYTGD